MFNSGRVRRNGFQDSQMDTIQQRLAQAAKARTFEKEGDVRLVGAMNITDEQAKKLPFALYRDGFFYYFRTHAHPNSTFLYTQSSLMDLMNWDVDDRMAMIHQPLFVIAGDVSDTRYMTDDAFKKATGTKDKELYQVKGAQHILGRELEKRRSAGTTRYFAQRKRLLQPAVLRLRVFDGTSDRRAKNRNFETLIRNLLFRLLKYKKRRRFEPPCAFHPLGRCFQILAEEFLKLGCFFIDVFRDPVSFNVLSAFFPVHVPIGAFRN